MVRSPSTCLGRFVYTPSQKPHGRFTPTCVGKRVIAAGQFRDEPRFTPTCVGKMVELPGFGDGQPGSPPRAWGRSLLFLRRSIRYRFTPTCVGKMSPALFISARMSVHPHVRGEDVQPRTFHSTAFSVHPHVRGEDVEFIALYVNGRRFTPTCVGKMEFRNSPSVTYIGSPPRAWGRSGMSVFECRCTPVHPHVRGEDASLAADHRRLPVHPHVRGEDGPQKAVAVQAARFTPTCVGKIVLVLTVFVTFIGSPPRAWGRFPRTAPRRFSAPVHPHVRGEDVHRQVKHIAESRFTPTCVGKI